MKHKPRIRQFDRSLQQRVTELQNLVQELHAQLDIANLMFDHIQNGAVVTDVNGYITHLNRPYAEFLGVKPKDVIGRKVVDVIDNTRMHIVARTGESEIMEVQHTHGKDLVVQRIPMLRDGKVRAVFGQIIFKDLEEVLSLVRRLELLESKVQLYEDELTSIRSTRYTFDNIIGVSPQIMSLKQQARHASSNTLTVLITGESGTGKEVFAQAIHHASNRRMHPFVRINCAAIPKDLFESELFGYAKGAFTGAKSHGKPGKFELASRGTILLDEIGELPMELQAKLLRVLEEKEVERVGGTTPIKTNFRLICTTNQDLGEMLSKNRFRRDLFYRIYVIPLHITPIRERPEDIIPISRYMLKQICHELSVPDLLISPQAESVLSAYHWPGNVRELYNILERVVSNRKGDIIRQTDLPFYLNRPDTITSKGSKGSLKEIIAEAERNALIDSLAFTSNNKAKAAKMLGIDRTLLYRKMKKHSIPLHHSKG